jgi:hypothetical protein
MWRISKHCWTILEGKLARSPGRRKEVELRHDPPRRRDCSQTEGILAVEAAKRARINWILEASPERT